MVIASQRTISTGIGSRLTVTINANGHAYKGHEETDDMYTSIDKAMEKVERQIDKTKGRIRAGRTSANI